MPHDHTTPTPHAIPEPERWSAIGGWPEYEVSTLGRARSYKPSGMGRTARTLPRLLKAAPSPLGYPRITMSRGKAVRKEVSVHLLVLETFRGPRPRGAHGCHNDGNPSNNRLDNLRWDTPSANGVDKVRHGRHRGAKIATGDVPAIWARLVAGEEPAAIAVDYGLVTGSISNIKSGRSWSHVTRALPGWPLVPPADPATPRPIHPSREFCDPAVEVWRPLPDFPAYRVSNRGAVQSCWKRGRGNYRYFMSDRWKEIKPVVGGSGYAQFSASAGPEAEKPKKRFLVHQAVLIAFAGPCPPGLVACHGDGNPANNHAGNLRWDTYRSNLQDRYRHERGG